MYEETRDGHAPAVMENNNPGNSTPRDSARALLNALEDHVDSSVKFAESGVEELKRVLREGIFHDGHHEGFSEWANGRSTDVVADRILQMLEGSSAFTFKGDAVEVLRQVISQAAAYLYHHISQVIYSLSVPKDRQLDVLRQYHRSLTDEGVQGDTVLTSDAKEELSEAIAWAMSRLSVQQDAEDSYEERIDGLKGENQVLRSRARHALQRVADLNEEKEELRDRLEERSADVEHEYERRQEEERRVEVAHQANQTLRHKLDRERERRAVAENRLASIVEDMEEPEVDQNLSLLGRVNALVGAYFMDGLEFPGGADDVLSRIEAILTRRLS